MCPLEEYLIFYSSSALSKTFKNVTFHADQDWHENLNTNLKLFLSARDKHRSVCICYASRTALSCWSELAISWHKKSKISVHSWLLRQSINLNSLNKLICLYQPSFLPPMRGASSFYLCYERPKKAWQLACFVRMRQAWFFLCMFARWHIVWDLWLRMCCWVEKGERRMAYGNEESTRKDHDPWRKWRQIREDFFA